jgi:hypothetical protein
VVPLAPNDVVDEPVPLLYEMVRWPMGKSQLIYITSADANLASSSPLKITGLPDPFAPLMAYLREANQFVWLPALDVQEMLWTGYVNRGIQFGGGISAMPSLHLATSFSFALLGFAINRRLGLLFALFTGLILIGSVHLGWHYALDGYAAILATWPIWWAVGWFLDRPRVSWLLWGEAGPRRAAA